MVSKINTTIINGKIAIISKRGNGRHDKIVLHYADVGLSWGILDSEANRLLDSEALLIGYIRKAIRTFKSWEHLR